MSASGLPSVRPWRRPPRISTWSCLDLLPRAAPVARLPAREVGVDRIAVDASPAGSP